jgi:predicted lactoylglutathione lyase
MSKKVFVNLPVESVDAAIAFYTALGFGLNSQFTDAKAACIVVSEEIYVMALRRDFFATFTNKSVTDAKAQTEVLVALELGSRDEVDAMVRKALEAGGARVRDAVDHGFMYQCSFQDPDGHQWEPFCMDPKAVVPAG